MRSRAAYDYDIVLLSDLRYPGGNSASLAEEIKAQARAGYTTAVVHVPASHMSRTRCFNRKVARCLAAGLADLVPLDRPVRARALVIRQPRVLATPPAARPRIDADVTVLVANQPPIDGFHPAERPYYDVADIHGRARELFGDVLWAPIGPLVREVLVETGAAIPLREHDWVNILDVDEWRTERPRRREGVPVIGRHSRGHRSKWPSDRRELLAAYPDDDDVEVRILGGAEPALTTLGYQPPNWTVLPFGTMAPQEFLRGIDFFVYFHHPDWVEAFGRNIIEGMASGCPAILPPHFRALFGDACQYGMPDAVGGLLEEMVRRPELHREWSERSVSFAEDNYGATTHARRLAGLIGPPSRPVAPPRAAAARRVLLVSTEPEGVGSQTRLLRVADALPADVEPVLLLTAPAPQLARAAGILCELLPIHVLTGDGRAAGARIAEAAGRHRAMAVVLDGPAPSSGLAAAGVPVVQLTDAGVGSDRPGADGLVSFVVGDPLDAPAGRPVHVLRGARAVPHSREAARRHIGVDERERLVLLAPGADEDTTSVALVRAVGEALRARGWTVVLPEPVLATGAIRHDLEALRIPLHPLEQYLSAFDLAVAAPGRTVVAELVGARVPSVFLPLRRDRPVEPRAAVARERGLAAGLERFDEAQVDELLDDVADEARRRQLAAACAAVELADAGPLVVQALETAAGAVR